MPLFSWGKKAQVLKQAEYLLRECCRELKIGERAFNDGAKDWLGRRKWDEGGLDMKRAVYMAALSSSSAEISPTHFPPRGVRDHEAFTKKQFEELSLEDVVKRKFDHFFERLGKVGVSGVLDTVSQQVEKPLIESCLKWTGGNQQKAARALGVDRNTLRGKMKRFGIKAK